MTRPGSPERLCHALHVATRTLARCSLMVSEWCRCDGVATGIAKDGSLVCDVCATFLPDESLARYDPVPYAQAVRTAGLIMSRGASDFDALLPDLVGASTGLVAALPRCPPLGFGATCLRCKFSADPYALVLLDGELREATGSLSAPGSA